MNVLMITGSPRGNGNTAIALREMKNVFAQEGIEVTELNVGAKAVRGCIACNKCAELGKCVFDDSVNEAAPLLAKADGVVVASPVYYASANGNLISFLDRLFYSCRCDLTMKVGASVVCARRGGCSATFDELTNTLPFPECRWPPANTGTASTAACPARQSRTRRASRPCAPWPETWHFS